MGSIKNDDKEIVNAINDTYKKLSRKLRRSNFAEHKCLDLHVHTPASHDYVKVNEENDQTTEYKLLLEKIASSGVDIVAITDHNNINGYEAIQQIIQSDEDIEKKLSNKLILPGIEIDCYGNHFLVIFDNNIDTEKIKSFIYICGLKNSDNEEQSADRVTPLLLCEEAYKLNGIVMLAHADAKKGFMQSYFKSKDEIKEIEEFELIGQTVQNVLRSKSLLGISLNNLKNVETCESLLHNWGIENRKIIQSSDSHSSLDMYEGSGKPFGTKTCWMKMGNLSFKALVMSLKQQNSIAALEKPVFNKEIFIKGIAVRGGFLINNSSKNKDDFAIFPFSPELNCIIGARGTGKSTLIEIIDYIFNFETYYDDDIKEEKNRSPFAIPLTAKDIERHIIGRYNYAIIFMSCGGNVFAIHSNPKGFSSPNISIYEFDINKDTFINKCNCKKLTGKGISDIIKLKETFKVKVYKQKDLQEMTTTADGITKLIDGLNIIGIGHEYLEQKMLMKKGYKEIQSLCEPMVKDRWDDPKADYTDNNLEKKYLDYFKVYEKYIEYYKESITNINNRLKGKLELSYKIKFDDKLLYEMSKNISIQYERMHGNNYQLEWAMQKDFKLFIENNIKDCPDILFLIFTHNYNAIYKKLSLNNYGMSLESIKIIIDKLWNAVNQDYAPLLPLPIIDFKLNVNYEIKPVEQFVERKKLSFGQRTVGALLLIMHGATELGDKLPLIIDQPEDDLDNSYIYHMLVKQFCRVKENKQLLIATHNPNIPVCGEAENIIVLDSNGINGWVDCYGTVDNKSVSKAVLRILEGDFEAFKRRAEVYGFELIDLPTTK